MVQQLDICQRALSDFLEEKRSMFPRFYFIGDDDLLEVSAEALSACCNHANMCQAMRRPLFISAPQTPRGLCHLAVCKACC